MLEDEESVGDAGDLRASLGLEVTLLSVTVLSVTLIPSATAVAVGEVTLPKGRMVAVNTGLLIRMVNDGLGCCDG